MVPVPYGNLPKVTQGLCISPTRITLFSFTTPGNNLHKESEMLVFNYLLFFMMINTILNKLSSKGFDELSCFEMFNTFSMQDVFANGRIKPLVTMIEHFTIINTQHFEKMTKHALTDQIVPQIPYLTASSKTHLGHGPSMPSWKKEKNQKNSKKSIIRIMFFFLKHFEPCWTHQSAAVYFKRYFRPNCITVMKARGIKDTVWCVIYQHRHRHKKKKPSLLGHTPNERCGKVQSPSLRVFLDIPVLRFTSETRSSFCLSEWVIISPARFFKSCSVFSVWRRAHRESSSRSWMLRWWSTARARLVFSTMPTMHCNIWNKIIHESGILTMGFMLPYKMDAIG